MFTAIRELCTRRRNHRERGAVAVEFALVLPLLVMLLLGITTAGLSYTHAIGVTNAVREGARFGATTLFDSADADQWSADVIARVRATQFDDPSVDTEICVQLWQKADPPVVPADHVLSQDCDGPPVGVSLPNIPTDSPRVPADLPDGGCVVRVIAARPFTINIGVTLWNSVNTDYSISRYERQDSVSTCVY